MLSIEKTIERYYKSFVSDSNHRYSSWDNCFKYFRNKKKSKSNNITDLDCLHLGFYLASWGMYRGSSFLLNKSYKIHHPIIKELLNIKYKALWNLNFEKLTKDDKDFKLIFKLFQSLKNIYAKKTRKENISDTLITKVLLGTLCCTPAYDTYFKNGCSKKKVTPHSNFTEESFLSVIAFYKKNKKKFDSSCKKIFKQPRLNYPAMKIIDLYFWQLGKPKDKKHRQ